MRYLIALWLLVSLPLVTLAATLRAAHAAPIAHEPRGLAAERAEVLHLEAKAPARAAHHVGLDGDRRCRR